MGLDEVQREMYKCVRRHMEYGRTWLKPGRNSAVSVELAYNPKSLRGSSTHAYVSNLTLNMARTSFNKEIVFKIQIEISGN